MSNELHSLIERHHKEHQEVHNNKVINDAGDSKLALIDSVNSAGFDFNHFIPSIASLDHRFEHKSIPILPAGNGGTDVAFGGTTVFNFTGFDWLFKTKLHLTLPALVGVTPAYTNFADVFGQIYFQSASGDKIVLPDHAWEMVKIAMMNDIDFVYANTLEGYDTLANRITAAAAVQTLELDLTACKFFLDGVHPLPVRSISTPQLYIEWKTIPQCTIDSAPVTALTGITNCYLECEVINDKSNLLIGKVIENQTQVPFDYPIYQYTMSITNTGVATTILQQILNVNSQSVKGFIIHLLEDANYNKASVSDFIPDAGSTILANTDTYQVWYQNEIIDGIRFPLDVNHNVYAERKDLDLIRGTAYLDGYPLLYIRFSKNNDLLPTVRTGTLSLCQSKPLQLSLNLGAAPTNCDLFVLAVIENYISIKNGIAKYKVA